MLGYDYRCPPSWEEDLMPRPRRRLLTTGTLGVSDKGYGSTEDGCSGEDVRSSLIWTTFQQARLQGPSVPGPPCEEALKVRGRTKERSHRTMSICLSSNVFSEALVRAGGAAYPLVTFIEYLRPPGPQKYDGAKKSSIQIRFILYSNGFHLIPFPNRPFRI